MPELPEVETIRRGLEGRLVGKTIESVEVRAAKLVRGNPGLLAGRTIEAFERQGKLLIVVLDGGLVMTIHLKMTGQLIWKATVDTVKAPAAVLDDETDLLDELAGQDNAEMAFADEGEEDDEADDEVDAVVGGHPEKAYLQPLPHKHTHVIFSFSDGSKLYFNDLRKFGEIQILQADELGGLSFLQNLGPEPLEPGFTRDYLLERLKKHPNVAIKSFLLDQGNIAGLGNIYADESLFRAAILPDRTAGSLTDGEARNLFDAIQETLELAIMYGGSSERDYVNAVGEKGTYLKIANVYRRTGLDCNRCMTGVIVRKKIGGRSSHYCEICQR